MDIWELLFRLLSEENSHDLSADKKSSKIDQLFMSANRSFFLRNLELTLEQKIAPNPENQYILEKTYRAYIF